MSIFSKARQIIAQSHEGNLIKNIGEVVDRFITTKEEKEQLQQELTKLIQQHEQAMENNLTDRLKLDMASDSFLSKNVRPLTLLYLIGFLTIMILGDSAIVKFEIKDEYIQLIKELLMMAFAFYFGGRTIEKVFRR